MTHPNLVCAATIPSLRSFIITCRGTPKWWCSSPSKIFGLAWPKLENCTFRRCGLSRCRASRSTDCVGSWMPCTVRTLEIAYLSAPECSPLMQRDTFLDRSLVDWFPNHCSFRSEMPPSSSKDSATALSTRVTEDPSSRRAYVSSLRFGPYNVTGTTRKKSVPVDLPSRQFKLNNLNF